VEVLCSEGVAIHTDPEPCVVVREGGGEASAGDRAGWPLSRERLISRAPTALPSRKATRAAAIARAAALLGVVRDPSMHGRSSNGNREISCLSGSAARRGTASGRPHGRSR